MTISRPDLAAMPRHTPSGLAEEAYRPRKPKVWPAVVGPAGIAIPDPRSPYQPKTDQRTLDRMIDAAYADYRAEAIPAAEEAATIAALAAALLRAWPQDDMTVLRKYDLAQVYGTIRVDLGGGHKEPVLVLPEPLLLPKIYAHFRVTAAGGGIEVPEAQLGYFASVIDYREARTEFRGASYWPAGHKAREGQWPTWGRIEAQWERLGAWMAGQRGQTK